MQVMKMCYNANLFKHLNDRFIEYLLPNENHYLLLIKAIAKEYFEIRFNHYTKQFNSEPHIRKIRKTVAQFNISDYLVYVDYTGCPQSQGPFKYP